jgi:hypothetical protein
MRFILTCAVALGLAASNAAAGEDGPVLTKADVWRCFYTFGAGQSESGTPYTTVRTGEKSVKAVAPPADWAKPEFDDLSWVPLRGGLETDLAHIVRQAYFRGCFEVADPDAAKGLRLLVAVRGGAVAYVNGEEVGRVAVPAGPVTAETWADSYPMEAYGAKQADGKVKWFADFDYGAPYTDGAGYTYFAGSGDKYALSSRNLSWPQYQAPLSKEDWEKLGNLRNRKVDVEIPQKLLRKGRNVVAFALCCSKTRVVTGFKPDELPRWDIVWPHGSLLDVKLTCAAGGAATAARGAKGLQVWTADIHQRLFTFDYPPYGAPPARIDLAGARNGVFSGQVAVRSDATLAGLSATAGDLAGPGGARIPASAVQVRYGLASPARNLTAGAQYGVPPGLQKSLDNYARELSGVPQKERLGKLSFFDQLSSKPPAEVPADACQPIWVTVRVPKDAAAGEYKGTLTIKLAGAKPAGEDRAGGEAAVPVSLKVSDWVVPDPKDYVIMVGAEQSPWGVLAAYPKVKPWSDEHFKLIEKSFRLLAELGSENLTIPLQAPSEFGNRIDSLVPWVKKDGGGYDYDFTRLDRYLEVAGKCLGRINVIMFVVVDPYPGAVNQHGTMVLDKATGKQEHLKASAAKEEGGKLWAECAKAVHAHMKEKGLANKMYWGQIHDFPLVEQQKPFTEAVPEVPWARSSHQGAVGRDLVKYAATILISAKNMPVVPDHRSRLGWKNPELHVVFPRIENVVLTVDTFAEPLAFRVLPEKSLTAGFRGVGSLGFDYWGNYAAAWDRGGNNTNVNMLELAWPGPDGAEGTARFEIFREGLQEAEARIAVEKILDGGLGKTPDGAKAWEALDARVLETGFIPSHFPSPMAQYYTGWQERSRRLYEAVAAVAGRK